MNVKGFYVLLNKEADRTVSHSPDIVYFRDQGNGYWKT